MHCNLVLSLSHLKIFYPFLMHQILTLTLIYSCTALITQHSRNHHTEFTTHEAGILLHQPSSNPRTYNLRSILVHHPTDVYTPNHPSPNRHPALTEPSPYPEQPSLNPHPTLTNTQPSSYPRPPLFIPSPTQPSPDSHWFTHDLLQPLTIGIYPLNKTYSTLHKL